MKIEYWPQRGSFEESKKEHKEFLSLQAALDYVIENSKCLTGVPLFSLKDIYITHYGVDSRLQNECFMLCVGKYGGEDYLKKYKHPMCHGYLYFEVFKAKEDTSASRFINSLFDKKISASTLRTFLVENCNVPERNIELIGDYCHFINKKEI